MGLPENKNVNVFSRQFTIYNAILKILSSRESWCSGDLRISLVRLQTKIPWACIFSHIGHRP